MRRQRVIVVDTSNEIAGDGDVPHPCIGETWRACQMPACAGAACAAGQGSLCSRPPGLPHQPTGQPLPHCAAGRARRMMVPDRSAQHEILIEAVRRRRVDQAAGAVVFVVWQPGAEPLVLGPWDLLGTAVNSLPSLPRCPAPCRSKTTPPPWWLLTRSGRPRRWRQPSQSRSAAWSWCAGELAGQRWVVLVHAGTLPALHPCSAGNAAGCLAAPSRGLLLHD